MIIGETPLPSGALGVDAIAERVTGLAVSLRDQLGALPGLTLHDRGVERCGIVTFTLPGIAADAVKAALRGQAINVTVSMAESTRLDMIPRGLHRIVRASLHYYNSEEEIEAFTQAIARLAREKA